MFDAAHAAMLRSSTLVNPAEIRTHNGLIGAFGKHLVKPGLASTELGRAQCGKATFNYSCNIILIGHVQREIAVTLS